MRPTKVAKGGGKRKIRYTNMDLRMDARIAREVNENSTQSYLVKNFKHSGGRVGKEICQNGFR
jgi:hypothetical protein